MTDWVKLKVADLRAELKERGLPATGVKAELVARLSAADSEAQPEEDENDQVEQDPEPEPEETPSTEEEPIKPEEPSLADAPAVNPDTNPGADPSTDEPTEPATAPLETKFNPEPAPAAVEEPAPSQPAPPGPPLLQQTSIEPPKVNTLDILRDAQKRKRRSASPPPSVHDTKRTKVDVEEAPQAGIAMDGVVHVAIEEKEEPKIASGEESPRNAVTSKYDDSTRVVPAAIHTATSALYIKNFMRPLHIPEFKTHLVELAAAPGADPDDEVIVDCFLDTIRTHALVRFTSTVAAQRVRSSLHDTVFPKESNRKALWVDFIPADRVQDWIDREEREPRGSSTRFEVVYDETDDGVIARLAEIGPGSSSARPRGAPAAPAPTPQPPTGPRIHPGVEGAPLAPRGDSQHGRGGPAFRTPRINDPSIRTTRADPMLYWKPIPDDLAQRRIENMRRFYNPNARVTDDDKRNNINRYFFENGDSFVDRGKEIFAGIRPPHREREHRRMMREQRLQGSSSRLLEPSRRDRNVVPPPQSFRPGGGDRYMGSAARGDSWREGNTYSRNEERRYRDYRGRPGRRR